MKEFTDTLNLFHILNNTQRWHSIAPYLMHLYLLTLTSDKNFNSYLIAFCFQEFKIMITLTNDNASVLTTCSI